MTDVVVVGAGGAGLAAALAAAEAGARVVVLEKEPAAGGTTAMSIGSITASGTPWQRRARVADSADAHFADFDRFPNPHNAADDPALRRVLVENVPQTLAWLGRLGLAFLGPMPEPPHTRPRMHNVLPNGRAYIAALVRACRRRGVEIRTGVRAQRLVLENGRVVGVDDIRAGRAVVLATGDYSASEELRRTFLPPEAAALEAINPAATGEGHRLALAVGARVLNGHQFVGPEIRFVRPVRRPWIDRLPPTRVVGHAMRLGVRLLPRPLLQPLIASYLTAAMAPSLKLFDDGAMLVNTEGARIADQGNGLAYALAAQPGNVAFVVFDNRVAELYSAWPNFISTAPGMAYAYVKDYRRFRPDLYRSAPTPDALAAAINMPTGSLRLSGPGPYHALGPAKAWLMTTHGGIAVNTRLEVLDAADRPIPGLYAAGVCGQGALQLRGHGHTLGWAFTSGRIAGANAALRPRTADPIAPAQANDP